MCKITETGSSIHNGVTLDKSDFEIQMYNDTTDICADGATLAVICPPLDKTNCYATARSIALIIDDIRRSELNNKNETGSFKQKVMDALDIDDETSEVKIINRIKRIRSINSELSRYALLHEIRNKENEQ